ncbi:MAG TPA: FAD-dependent oxidoreductase [Bdellovibrionota bacterium]|nr:FAD-dependent oxidoreductase [Bdellovibrionota bacterium]
MRLDSDVVLLGTGLASLVAAKHLEAEGLSVLLLNPDPDFFLEDSELPLDPLGIGLSDGLLPERVRLNSPERALKELRPSFPGAVEFWSGKNSETGFHDSNAPHIRERGRLWIVPNDSSADKTWGELEDLYVRISDFGLNPQIMQGVRAAARFPGFSGRLGEYRGLWVPKFCDVDVIRYRNGILEFVRERLGEHRVLCGASQIEIVPEGIRFLAGTAQNPELGRSRAQGSVAHNAHTAKIGSGLLLFWTPRLSQWVLAQAKRAEVKPFLPKGLRVWEQWSLVSRDPLEPGVIGTFRAGSGELTAWAEIEGIPTESALLPNAPLAVLRAGPLLGADEMLSPRHGSSWASADSFQALSALCRDFFKWDSWTVRSMRARALFEWPDTTPSHWCLSASEPRVEIIPGADGPIIDVVQRARMACERVLTQASLSSSDSQQSPIRGVAE